MTFDDDFIQITFADEQIKRFFCNQQGVDWPPPLYVELHGVIYGRARMSEITDAQRANMTHVCRGAEYLPFDVPDGTEVELVVPGIPRQTLQ